ncbi:MAG: lipid II flippase MurJ, partial [Peptococcus niger]
VGYSQQQMLNRGFYAVRDTRSAVLMNVVVIGVNIALSFALVGPMNFRGLALAYSVAGLLAMVLLFFVLRYKIGPFGGRHIAASLAKVLVASAVMLVAVA